MKAFNVLAEVYKQPRVFVPGMALGLDGGFHSYMYIEMSLSGPRLAAVILKRINDRLTVRKRKKTELQERCLQ